jgi:hypothetical protein
MIQTNAMAFSLQVNYSDWVTATGQQILVPNFVDRGVLCGQRGGTPTAVNLSFLDWSHYLFFRVAPFLSSWGWVDPIPDPLLLRKFGSTCSNSMCSLHHHIDIFSLLELLYVAPKKRWKSDGAKSGCSVSFHFSFLRVYSVQARVWGQNALRHFPCSFRVGCRLCHSVNHVMVGCTCGSYSTFQVGSRNRPLRIPQFGQQQLAYW